MKKQFSPQSRIALMGAASLTALCMLFALIIALVAAQPDPQTNTSTLRNPLDHAQDGVSILLRADQSGDEYFAANHFPTLLGAKGDGVANDTKFLKTSLEHAKEAGGTVYLPQGIYRITEPLTIPAGVTLRGDFSAPNSNLSDGGKTILLVADGKAMQESPFLTLENEASLVGITVYYESQSPEKIIEYPATVYCGGTNTLRQVTLLNSYHGVCVTGGGAVTLSSLWISPLDYGILVTDNNRFVTVEDCHISPTYWLNYAPSVFSDGKAYPVLTAYLQEKMHGIILEKVTDVTLNRVSVEDASVGILYNVPKEQDSILLAKEVSISSAKRPLYLQSLPKAGLCVADSTLRPHSEAGADTVEIASQVASPVVFSNCTFAGLPKTVVKADNHSFVSFYHCNFGTWWNVCFEMKDDTFLAVSPTFKSTNEKAILGQNAFGILYNAPAIAESSQLLFAVPEGDAKITQNLSVPSLKTTKRTLTENGVINAKDFGVSPQSEDNSAALKQAFDEAVKTHSAVFLPEGVYKFKSIINVPESVRLIGVGSSGNYSTVLSFELQKNTDFSLIELQPSASVEDLEIRQGFIPSDSVNTYAISSLYANVRIHRVSITASRGIWLTGGENAVVENVTVNGTQTGILLKNTKGVTLHNVTVNDSARSFGTVGIRLENASATLSGYHGNYLQKALELAGDTTLSATLVNLRGVTTGIEAAHTGNLSMTAVGFSESGVGGNTLFFNGTQAMTGSATLQGVIATGSSLLGSLAQTQKGAMELRAGIITAPFQTTLSASENAEISVFGCIWDNTPTYHAVAQGGTITLAANLIKSDKTFEGIEGNYLLTATGEDAGKIDAHVNMLQHTYVYVESEDSTENEQE